MEDVAGAQRVDGPDRKGGDAAQAVAIRPDHAVGAERDRDEPRGEASRFGDPGLEAIDTQAVGEPSLLRTTWLAKRKVGRSQR